MNVQEICSHLAYGKLANLSMSGSGVPTGMIEVQHRPAVINAVNSALTRLHSRFVLKENGLIIALRNDISRYYLTDKYAESNFPVEGVEIPYLLDTVDEPYQNDLIRILQVYNSFAEELPINDPSSFKSVFTPQYNVIQVSRPETGQLLNVVYQANHPKVSHENPDDEIIVPDILFDALTSYTAHLIYSSINTQEAMMKASEQLAMYENICAEVENRDGVSNSHTFTQSKLENNGWA